MCYNVMVYGQLYLRVRRRVGRPDDNRSGNAMGKALQDHGRPGAAGGERSVTGKKCPERNVDNEQS